MRPREERSPADPAPPRASRPRALRTLTPRAAVQGFGGIDVVIDDQYSRRRPFFFGLGGRPHTVVCHVAERQRQPHGEDTAAAIALAVGFDRATMHAHKRSGQRQAKPRPPRCRSKPWGACVKSSKIVGSICCEIPTSASLRTTAQPSVRLRSALHAWSWASNRSSPVPSGRRPMNGISQDCAATCAKHGAKGPRLCENGLIA